MHIWIYRAYVINKSTLNSWPDDINLVEPKIRDQAVLSAGINETRVRVRLDQTSPFPRSTLIKIGKKLGKYIEKKKGDTQTHTKKKWGELTRRASISSRVQESLGAYRSCTTKRITVINARDGNQCQFSRRQEPLTIRLAVTFVHDWRGLIGLIGWSLQASLSLIKMTIRVFAACKTRHLSVAVSLLFRFPSLQTFSPRDIGFVWILVPSTDNLLVLNSTVLIYGTNSVPLRDFHPLWSS
jgi:hypothetical protein